MNETRTQSFFLRQSKTRSETKILSYSSHKKSQHCFQRRIFSQENESFFFSRKNFFLNSKRLITRLSTKKHINSKKIFLSLTLFLRKNRQSNQKNQTQKNLRQKKQKRQKSNRNIHIQNARLSRQKIRRKNTRHKQIFLSDSFRNQISKEFFNSFRSFLKMNTISTNQRNRRTHNQNLQKFQSQADQ